MYESIPQKSSTCRFVSTCCGVQVLPLLKELSKPSIVARHWKQVEEVIGKPLGTENEMTRLQALLDADLLQYKVHDASALPFEAANLGRSL